MERDGRANKKMIQVECKKENNWWLKFSLLIPVLPKPCLALQIEEPYADSIQTVELMLQDLNNYNPKFWDEDTTRKIIIK